MLLWKCIEGIDLEFGNLSKYWRPWNIITFWLLSSHPTFVQIPGSWNLWLLAILHLDTFIYKRLSLNELLSLSHFCKSTLLDLGWSYLDVTILRRNDIWRIVLSKLWRTITSQTFEEKAFEKKHCSSFLRTAICLTKEVCLTGFYTLLLALINVWLSLS